MAEVADTRALLLMALDDLADGERALLERLPVVFDHARDPAFRTFIEADRARSLEQYEGLAAIARAMGADLPGERNIWMRAVLDDAGNDAATIAEGPLRDVALVGALRKAKQSERVSYETALALARQLDLADASATLERIRDEESHADEALAAMLPALCANADSA